TTTRELQESRSRTQRSCRSAILQRSPFVIRPSPNCVNTEITVFCSEDPSKNREAKQVFWAPPNFPKAPLVFGGIVPKACLLHRSDSLAYDPKVLARFVFASFFFVFGCLSANAEVTAVSLQSPRLLGNGTTNLVSPIHVQATAEDASAVTGYVVY